MVAFSAFAVNTARSKTTGYSPFELVFGRPAVNLLDVPLTYGGFKKIVDKANFNEQSNNSFKKLVKLSRKVNRTHDKEKPRLDAKRSPATIFEGDDFVFEWRLLLERA